MTKRKLKNKLKKGQVINAKGIIGAMKDLHKTKLISYIGWTNERYNA